MFYKNKKKLTIIIPIYNAETTLKYVFNSLESQNSKDFVDSIIFINDNSNDNSASQLEEYRTLSSYRVVIINHDQNCGLAYNYNEGIAKCTSDFFVLMHQDVILEDKNSIKIVVENLEKSANDVVAIFPNIFHPLNIFKEYNFWQKCLFSRLINRKIAELNGKFDGFKKNLMQKFEISFDDNTFRTAGEDGDIRIKFQKNNLKIQRSGINVIHIHNKDKNFSLKNVIKKEAQLSEYYGALTRKYGLPNGIINFLLISFRPILIISLFIPIINFFAIIIIVSYAFLYTKNVYVYEYTNPRIIILPIVNIYLLLVGSFYYLKGFIYGKQKI